EHRLVEARVPGEVDATRTRQDVPLMTGGVDERDPPPEVARRDRGHSPATEGRLLPRSENAHVRESSHAHRRREPPGDHDRSVPPETLDGSVVEVVVVAVGN